ncbi:MAG: CRISPR-associated DxTHG motif protein [Infirmifilum sp.]
MARKILVVAPWGDPGGWYRGKYFTGKLCVESCSSLVPVMLKAFEDAGFENTRGLIVAVDTLSTTKEVPRSWQRAEELAKERAEEYWRYFIGTGEISDEKKKGKCEERGFKLCGDGLQGDYIRYMEENVKVVVLPGMGKFPAGDEASGQVRVTFQGTLTLYSRMVLLHVLREAMKMNPPSSEKLESSENSENSEKLEIWLDLSHGVNYMPSSALVAVLDAARILGYLMPVKVKVFNSTPYLRVISELSVLEMEIPLSPVQPPNPELEIDSDELKINPKNLRGLYNYVLKNPHKILIDDIKNKIGSELKEPKFEDFYAVEAFHEAMFHALPLVALDYLPLKLKVGEIRILKNLLPYFIEALYAALRTVEVTESGDGLTLETGQVVNKGILEFLPFVLECYALSEGLSMITLAYSRHAEEREGKKGYSLSSLRKFYNNVIVSRLPHVRVFIDNEVHDILTTVVLARRRGNWFTLDDLKSLANKKSESEKEEAKNFLDKNADGEIKMRELLEKKILVRYKDNFNLKSHISERNFRAHLGLTYKEVEIYIPEDAPLPVEK